MPLADEVVRELEEILGAKAIEDVYTDADLWESIRKIMVATVRPVFMAAYMVGVDLGGEEAAVFTPISNNADDLRLEIHGFRALPVNRLRAGRVGGSFIDRYTDEWWQQFSRSTQNGLRRAIQSSIDNGTGVNQVVKDITPLFGKKRAKLIAISESTNLMGGGAQETYREAGYRSWTWRTVNDLRVDSKCRRLNGKTFPMTVAFERAHPGCRCWPVPAGQPGGFDKLASTTKDLHYDPVKGWSPERAAFHDQIVAEHMASATEVAAGEQETVYMLGGGPASGKSTAIKTGQVQFPKNIVTVDSDALKARMPEYIRMKAAGDTRAAAFTNQESSYLSQRIVQAVTETRRNVLLDGTGDGDFKLLTQRIESYRRNGHRVVGEYMTLDTDTALMIQRFRAAATGRYVPENIVVKTHATISETLPRVVRGHHFDEWRLFDTNVKDVSTMIAEYRDGSLQILDDVAWRRFLAKGDDVEEWLAGTLGPETGEALGAQVAGESLNAAQQEAFFHFIEQLPATLGDPGSVTRD